MKITKLLLTCTAVAALGTAFSAGVNAEIITNTSYDKTAGTVNVASDLKSHAGEQMTVVIIPEAVYNKTEDLTDDKILYIDQAAAKSDAAIFQALGIKGGTALADGDYYIKIGGANIKEDGIIVEKFTVKTTPTGKTYYVGNLVGDYEDADSIDSKDAMQIVYYSLGVDCVFDEYFDDDGNVDLNDWIWTAANITGDLEDEESIDSKDAMQIIYYSIGKDSAFDDYFDDNDEYVWTFER